MRVAERGRDGFQRTVDEMLATYGWRFYGVIDQLRYARRTLAGFPDRVAWRGRELIFIEVKGTGGKLTDAQLICIGELTLAGQRVYVWQPETPQEEIEEVLR